MQDNMECLNSAEFNIYFIYNILVFVNPVNI